MWGFSSKAIRFLPLLKQLTAFTSGEVFLCAAELVWKSENNSLRGSSVLPSPGFWGSNSSCQTWWQVPLPTEPSHSLVCAYGNASTKSKYSADVKERKWRSFGSQPEHWHGATWTTLQGWPHHRAHSGFRGKASYKQEGCQRVHGHL